MANERVDGFIFYASYYDGISELTDEEQGRLYKAIMDYAFTAKEPELSGASSMAFKFIRPTLDANIKRRLNGKKGAEYGVRGGRPKTPRETPTETPSETPLQTPKQTPSETPKDKIRKDNINNNNKENASLKRSIKESTASRRSEDNEKLQLIVDAYNAICYDLPKATKLTEDRKKHIRARLKDYSEEELGQAFKKAQASDFLSGRKATGRDWRADLDWIISSPQHMQKILEGAYDNKEPRDAAENVARQFIASASPEAVRSFEESMNGGRS